jgi:para-nitrobenzyl esterase
LIFDTARDGGLRMAALRQTLPQLKQELMTGQAPVPKAVVAQTFARTFLWSPLFSGHATLAEYEQVRQRFGGEASAAAYRPRLEV